MIDDAYVDNIERVLAKGSKKISKAIDKGDYDKVKKAVETSEGQIIDAIES